MDQNQNKQNKTDFESSLESLKVKDIKPAYKGKNQSLINTDFIIRTIALILCTAIFLYSGYTIVKKLVDDYRAEQLLAGIVDLANTKSEVTKATASKNVSTTLTLFDALGEQKGETPGDIIDEYGEYDAIRYRLLDLKAVNPDIYGWIRITGMVADTVEYPMVQAADNDYYLYKNIYRQYSESGSIFVDFRNSKIHEKNYNTIFYGHNMTNGSMFRPVMRWFENPQRNSLADTIKIEVITLDAAFVYEIFASYRSTGAHFTTTSFANESEYYDFLRKIYSRSVFKRNVKFDKNSRIITLSTCTNVVANEDERYVVHAILKQIIRYS